MVSQRGEDVDRVGAELGGDAAGLRRRQRARLGSDDRSLVGSWSERRGDGGHRDVHQSVATVGQRRERRGGGDQSAGRVGERIPAEQQAGGVAEHRAAGRRGIVAERDPAVVWRGAAVAGQRHPQPRPAGEHPVRRQTHGGERPGPARLDDDVGRGDEVAQPALAIRIAEVEPDGALSCVHQVEEGPGTEPGAVGPHRGLDLDHRRTGVGEHTRAQRPRPQRRQVDDDDVLERADRRCVGHDSGDHGWPGVDRRTDTGDREAQLNRGRHHHVLRPRGDRLGRRVEAVGDRARHRDSEPRGEQFEIVDSRDGHRDPTIGCLNEAAPTAATGRAVPTQPEECGALREHGDRVEHHRPPEATGQRRDRRRHPFELRDETSRRAQRRAVGAPAECSRASPRPRIHHVIIPQYRHDHGS